jgi:hypothetical protein
VPERGPLPREDDIRLRLSSTPLRLERGASVVNSRPSRAPLSFCAPEWVARPPGRASPYGFTTCVPAGAVN